MLTLKVVPSTISSYNSTKRKSKILSQFGLGHVAPFIANVREKAVTMHPSCVAGPCRPTLSLIVEKALVNNIKDAKSHPHPICILGWARHSREDGSRRRATRKTKRLKKPFGPIGEATKTKTLAEIDDAESDSNDSNARLSRGNNDTIHAIVPYDSTYFEGDE